MMKSGKKVLLGSMAVSSTVLVGCMGPANAEGYKAAFREFKQNNPGISNHALKHLFKQSLSSSLGAGGAGGGTIPPITIPVIAPAIEPHIVPPVHTIPTNNNHHGGSRPTNQNNGGDIDLSSTVSNITLGGKIFDRVDSVTIKVGDDEKTLAVGSQVTAAEYVAAKQVLLSNSQSLVVDNSGRAVGGSLDLSQITAKNDRLRADDFVVPENVSAFGDFGKGSTFQVLGDLINSGSIYAWSTKNDRGGVIRADNITNQEGALITSKLPTIYTLHVVPNNGFNREVDLTLRADESLSNYGTISSSGDLTISAGNSIRNGSDNYIGAKNSLRVEAPKIHNAGTMEAGTGRVTLASSIPSVLEVTNVGGTIIARNGDINVRDKNYNDAFNTYINGGKLLSENVNVNTGRGVADINVDEMSGQLNEKGLASHVVVAGDLNLGTICLTGDPTYSAFANMTINGNITVGEQLVLLANNDIIAPNPVVITAASATQGFDVTMVAGSIVNVGGGTNNIPPLPPVGTASEISGATSGAGGNISLQGSIINARATAKSGNLNGGNVLLAAYEGNDPGNTGGFVSFGAINTGGKGTGDNGDVTIIMGGSDQNVDQEIGSINTTGGTGSAGDISISAFQPRSSDNNPVSFDAAGNVTSGNTIIPGAVQTADALIRVRGSLIASGDVLISSAAEGGVRFEPNVGVSANSSNGVIDIDVFGSANLQLGGNNFFSAQTLDLSLGTGDAGQAGVSAVQTNAKFVNAVGSMASSNIVIVNSSTGLTLWSGSAFELNLGSAGTFMSNPGSGPLTGNDVLVGSFNSSAGLNAANPIEVNAVNLFVTAGKRGDVFLHNNNNTGTTTLQDTVPMIGNKTFSIVSENDLAMETNASISADNVILRANGAGGFAGFGGTVDGDVSIQFTSNATIENAGVPASIITAALITPRLVLTSLAGDIGQSTAVRFTAPTTVGSVIANATGAGGDVNLGGAVGAKSFAIGGFADGAFDYVGVASVTLRDTSTTNGDINVVTTAGTLKIDTNAVVQSGEDILLMVDPAAAPASKDKIVFSSGSTVQTFASPGNGDITVTIDPVNVQPGTPPTSGVSFAEFGSGNINWGQTGISGKGANSVVAKDADVNFSSPVSNRAISLAGGVLIFADPPSTYSSESEAQSETQRLTNALASRSLDSDGAKANWFPSSTTSINQIETQSVALSGGATFGDFSFNPSLNVLQNNSNLITGQTSANLLNTMDTAGFLDLEDDSYIISRGASEADASICSNEITYNAIAASGIAHGAKAGHIMMEDNMKAPAGNTLFVADRPLSIETNAGTVSIDEGAVVLVSNKQDGAAVYNVHDNSKEAVKLSTGGKDISIAPGRHVLVTRNAGDFASVNHVESIPHRGVQTKTLGGDMFAHTSDFSPLSAMATVKPLRAVLASKDPISRKIAEKMLKTSAILMHINNSAGSYQFYAKPRITALHGRSM